MDKNETREKLINEINKLDGYNQMSLQRLFQSAQIDKSDYDIALDIFWDFFRIGALKPMQDYLNSSISSFSKTKFGVELFSNQNNLYSTSDYIKNFDDIDNFDSIIREYIEYGHRCFIQNLFNPSVIMFGVASERAIYILGKAISSKTSDNNKKKEIDALVNNGKIKRLIESISKYIKGNSLDFEILESSSIYLLCMLETIRVLRNRNVHPSDSNISKEDCCLIISSFPAVMKKIYKIIAELN